MKSQDLIGYNKLLATKKSVIFLANLLQDIAIFKSLIFLLSDELDCNILICMLPGFRKKDHDMYFCDQLRFIANHTNACLINIESDQDYFELLSSLTHKGGLVISSSESKILDTTHSYASTLLSMAPKSSFSTITIQHGHECLGFLHNDQHTKNYGEYIGFRADYVIAWDEVYMMKNLAPTTSSKVLTLGNPTRISSTSRRKIPIYDNVDFVSPGTGLICENLHSVRFTNEQRVDYLENLLKFANHLALNGKSLAIRSHPAGQYFAKNNIKIPDNCFYDTSTVENSVRKKYSFVISPPSTVIYDYDYMSVPCAIYQGNDRSLDLQNYERFVKIKNLNDMIAFSTNPKSAPASLNSTPHQTLTSNVITANYLEFFLGLLNIEPKKKFNPSKLRSKSKKVLILAPDSELPSAHICLAIPLAATTNQVIVHDERTLLNNSSADTLDSSLRECILENSIDVVIFCRFYGETNFLDILESLRIPTLYFIDDELLKPCPISLGLKKFQQHGSSDRIQRVRYFLERVDCVYASTSNLKTSLLQGGITTKIMTSRINCSPISSLDFNIQSYTINASHTLKKIGYMGFGHKADFDIVALPIQKLLEEDTSLTLELIGSIEIPSNLSKFESRITVYPPIFNYFDFLHLLRSLNWSVGLCPLVKTPFNRCKSINKWIEYSSSLIPVVASKGVIYDQCIGSDSGILCDDDFESWYHAIKSLIYNDKFSSSITKAAYFKAHTMYSHFDHGLEIDRIIEESMIASFAN